MKGLDLGSSSKPHSAPEALWCCNFQGLKAGKLKQMARCGQMARLVAQ